MRLLSPSCCLPACTPVLLNPNAPILYSSHLIFIPIASPHLSLDPCNRHSPGSIHCCHHTCHCCYIPVHVVLGLQPHASFTTPICQICALYCTTNHQLHIPHICIPREQDFWGEDYTPTWNFSVPGYQPSCWTSSKSTSPQSSLPPSAFATSLSSLTESPEKLLSAATSFPSTGTQFKLGSYQLHD